MPTFIAVAYYGDSGGRPILLVSEQYRDVIRFMSDNAYMEISVYQKDSTGIILLYGKDLTGS